MNGYRIRDADVSRDRPALERMAAALSEHERRYEHDRSPGHEIAGPQVDDMLQVAADRNGRIFVAESPEGDVVGWAVCTIKQNSLFIVAEERTFGYVNELFVDDSARGCGVGQLLMAACERHFLSQGVKVSMLSALWRNDGARDFYDRLGYRPYEVEYRKYL